MEQEQLIDFYVKSSEEDFFEVLALQRVLEEKEQEITLIYEKINRIVQKNLDNSFT